MLKTKKRGVSLILSMVMLVAVILSMFTMTASAQTPNLNSNPNYHTACFTYNIRSTWSSSGNIVETVSKAKNRASATVYSDNYSYDPDDWMQIKSSDNDGGYVRMDLVCPLDRCYKVNTSAGLRVRSTKEPDSAVLYTAPNGTYFQVLDVVGGSDISHVRVRTGDREGLLGYVANAYITQVNSHMYAD